MFIKFEPSTFSQYEVKHQTKVVRWS